MEYAWSGSSRSNGEAATRRQILFMVWLCLFLHLPARSPALVGRITGKRKHMELARDLVTLATDPYSMNKRSVIEWALSYCPPLLTRRLMRTLSASGRLPAAKPDWRLGIMRRADPRLLLPREHATPVFQSMRTSDGIPSNALVCFTGNALKLNIPVQLFHCAVAGRFDLLIYLRDPSRRSYVHGMPGLGTSLEELALALRSRIPAGCRIAVLGTSLGGIGAARVAGTLRAERLALFSPPFRFRDTTAMPDDGLSAVNEIRLYFSRNDSRDLRYARDWGSVPGVPGFNWLDSKDHATLAYLAGTDGIPAFLDWLAPGYAETNGLPVRRVRPGEPLPRQNSSRVNGIRDPS